MSLELCGLKLFIVDDFVLADALHGVLCAILLVLDQEHFTERANAQYLLDCKVLERRVIVAASRIYS